MSKSIIERLGETDQLFLQENSAVLALERGELRLKLVALSKNKQEKIHFLHEALAILEQARLEFENIEMALYLDLSVLLGRAYMVYFELTQDSKFLIITQQIIKPLTSSNRSEVFLLLAHVCSYKKEFALTKHWLKKYIGSEHYDD